jgi:tetratricopeptide (TPR) repeat protein
MLGKIKDLLQNPILLLCVIPTCIYGYALFCGFVYDDIALTVVNNPVLTGDLPWTTLFAWDRPVREFTILFDHILWGMNPFGYHLQNLLWHCANTVLIFFFLRFLRVEKDVAFWSSLLFSIHPINSESVVWISARKELLCLFFEVGACFLFVRAVLNNNRFEFIASMVSLVLALYSKQVAIVLPALMLLSLWFYHQQVEQPFKLRLWYKWFIAPIVIVGLYLIFSSRVLEQLIFVETSGTYYDPAARDVEFIFLSAILTPFAILSNSIWLYFVPIDLTVERAFEPVTSLLDMRWISGLFLLTYIIYIFVMYRKEIKGLSFGIGWFLITWLPVSGFAPVAYLMADRYLYIPGMGFCFLMILGCYLMYRFFSLRFSNVVMTIGLILLLLFYMRTAVRTFDWKDEISLWTSAVRARPHYAKAYVSLANAYSDIGDRKTAQLVWNKALSLNPNLPQVWLNQGISFKRQENYEAAERCYKKALELLPTYGRAHYNLGLLYMEQALTKQALHHFQAASEHLYDRLNTAYLKGLSHYHIARIFFSQHNEDTALIHLKQAQRLAPGYAPIYNLNGLIHQNNPEVARDSFQKAIQINPIYDEAYYNLGLLEWNMGNKEKADEHWNKAAELKPSLAKLIKSVKNPIILPQK